MRFFWILLPVSILASCQDSKFKGYSGAITGNKTDQPTTASTPQGGTTTGTNSTTTPPNNGFDIDLPNLKGFDVDFGKWGTYWHLGNNDYKGSSCKMSLNVRQTKTAYSFNFYVEQDNTTIGNIKVSHCGVDPFFANQNKVILYGPDGNNGWRELDVKALPESSNAIFKENLNFGSKSYAKGWYKIRVESSFVNPANNDRDDFIVGNIKLQGVSAPVQIGTVDNQ